MAEGHVELAEVQNLDIGRPCHPKRVRVDIIGSVSVIASCVRGSGGIVRRGRNLAGVLVNKFQIRDTEGYAIDRESCVHRHVDTLKLTVDNDQAWPLCSVRIGMPERDREFVHPYE